MCLIIWIFSFEAAETLVNIANGKSVQKQAIIETDAILRLLELLKSTACYLSMHALVNIVAGTCERKQVIVQVGAVPLFSEILRSSYTDVSEL